MKIALAPTEDHPFSIMQRILDGKVTITSPEEFADILAIYPNDPFLHRKYADLLNDFKLYDEAAASYEKASRLFIDRRMNLQAIVAKILQWSIQKVSHRQGQAFYEMLHEEGGQHTPLQRFWARMSYAELVAVMRRLVRVRIPAGSVVTRIDDPAEEVFFVVFGTLCEMPSPVCADEADRTGMEIEPVLLGPNDIFGDIFPLDKPSLTATEIRTITDVELVKIAKPVLHTVCCRYPRIEHLLQEIHRPEIRENCDRNWQTVRRAMRYGLPTRIEITCMPLKPGQKKFQYTGITADLSLGGMCMEISDNLHSNTSMDLKGRLVRISLDLLNDVALLNLSGKVVWQSRQTRNMQAITLIGIRFDTLSALDRDMLAEYCSGSVGEQNLLWSLWDTMVHTDNSL